MVGDDPVFSHAIYVGGDRDPISIEFVNDVESDICVVQFAPTNALSHGLNRLRQFVPPGQSVQIALAAGSYRARVIDCDGALRFEDSTGTLLDGDNTLTVR